MANSPRETVILVILAAALAALDISVGLQDKPSYGFVLPLLVDLSLPLLVQFPRSVAGYSLLVTALMVAAQTFAPGHWLPIESVTPTSAPRAITIVIYWVVLTGDRRFALRVVAIFAVLAGHLWHPTWDVTPFGLLSTLVPALFALYWDARKQLVQSWRDRAERAEREQHLLAEQARIEERRRLAAEMHDVVSHELSLIVLHAGALRLTSSEDAVQNAAEDIRQSGTHALRELRDLVGLLRSEEPAALRGDGAAARDGTAPPAATPDMNKLITDTRSVGVDIDFDSTGDPAQISPTVLRTGYRVVQEALTNVRKHAPGSHVTVGVRYRPQGVEVDVTNSVPTGTPDPVLADSGSKAGLSGLRQRVELVGGTMAAGPTPSGGYRLHVILPAYVPTTESKRNDSSRPGR